MFNVMLYYCSVFNFNSYINFHVLDFTFILTFKQSMFAHANTHKEKTPHVWAKTKFNAFLRHIA